MRSECLNFKYAQQEPHPVGQLISHLSSKMQVCTQRYDRRPYGVGLLIAGYDVCKQIKLVKPYNSSLNDF